MKTLTIVDTSAIVGLLSHRDQWRDAALRHFGDLDGSLVTCEAVITECCFLLRRSSNGERQVLEMINSEILGISFSLMDEIERVQSLMSKYRSVPMSLADACLVRMSEIYDAPVFTFDDDFKVYRRNGRQSIPLIGVSG